MEAEGGEEKEEEYQERKERGNKEGKEESGYKVHHILEIVYI